MKLSSFKKPLIDFLRGSAVKLALKKILGSAAAGGFVGWIVTYIVTELFEEIAEPLILAGINRIGYTYDKIEGKVLIKELNEAENETDYDSTVNDILN